MFILNFKLFNWKNYELLSYLELHKNISMMIYGVTLIFKTI